MSRRDFDKDGAQSDISTNGNDDGSSGDEGSSLLDGATVNNDSFRELYSILKAEESNSGGEEGTHKMVRDMAIATVAQDAHKAAGNEGNVTASSMKSLVGKSSSGGSLHRSGSPCSSTSSGSDVGVGGNVYPDSAVRYGDEGEPCDEDEDPDMSISSSMSQALMASSTSHAIRGSSVMRLDARDGASLYRPSDMRRDTYTSPFRAKAVDNSHCSKVPTVELKPAVENVRGYVLFYLCSVCDVLCLCGDMCVSACCVCIWNHSSLFLLIVLCCVLCVVCGQEDGRSTTVKPVAVGADDFLPMFTYVLVQSELPQLLLVKELMVTLVDNEEMYGECGE
jgi:hypothetical protein